MLAIFLPPFKQVIDFQVWTHYNNVMEKSQDKEKIFVGMSGGVDSSVAAALLKKATPNNFKKLFGRPAPKGFRGYDVSGVFIKGYYPQNIPCTWREDRRDAMRVAAILGIPFYTFDFSAEYKKHVIDYMIKEYKEGRTPNPDIMCNKHIKFDLFLKKALEMGADKIATGHYARLHTDSFLLNLISGKDSAKDQSYFLWTLGQEQLKHCLFPIGPYLKEEVRELARKFKLPTAEKKDSQGLCFVGEFNLEDFLKEHINPEPGKIVNEKGEEVGSHNGVQYYTIGQRHGIGAGGGKEPYYIVEKDIKKNILKVASEKKQKDFSKKEIEIKEVNWLSGKEPDLSKEYYARIRYRQPLQKCKIVNYGSEFKNRLTETIEFMEPQKAVASGQSLAIYNGLDLVGGGIILL